MANNKINEELEKFKRILGYDPSLGTINENRLRREAPGYRDYMGDMLTEADPEEEETEEEPAEEGGEEEGGEENADFDFGDEGNPEEGGEDTATEEEPAEEETDEFGTADEFSAADELEGEGEEVEEIDVTSIVKGSDEAKEMAQQAVSVGQENMAYLKALTDKLTNLESQLTKMDSIASKITKLEQDIKTPEEKLELRSLDSYPFNMKLSDYWQEKANNNPHYRVTSGQDIETEKEYVITPEMIEDFSDVDIKKTFVPESVSKKKILTEGEKEQTDAKSRIEAILSGLSPKDKQEVIKSMSKKTFTKQDYEKNLKKK